MIEGVNHEGTGASAPRENKGGNLSDLAAFVNIQTESQCGTKPLTSDSNLREENQ
jgi:hypothetical protein